MVNIQVADMHMFMCVTYIKAWWPLMKLSWMDNAMQPHLNTRYIFFTLGDNLSPYNYCMYVLVLIIFQCVNAFPGTEAEQMNESANCFFPS